MTRLIPDWEIRITNFGLGYILMCLVVAIGATNTGNNGLYLVLAAMLSAMVNVSGFSQYTSLPLRKASMAIRACQWSGVAMVTAWMSLRSSSSVKFS